MIKPIVYLHIGAHKTATTHFQDTLHAMQETLVEMDINYLYRPFFRNGKIDRLKNMARARFTFFDGLTFGHFSKIYLNAILGNYFPTYKNIIISEENILGYAWQLLSVRPFLDMLEDNLSFVHYLNNSFHVKFLFSIRNFKDIYPGAYTTALRFNPKDAMIAKRNLCEALESGYQPSWVELIENIKKLFPNNEIVIWTQEDYRKNSAEIISRVFNVDVSDVPVITPPSETVTPNSLAVQEVESLVSERNIRIDNWTAVCDRIYAENSVSSMLERYTFLSNKLQLKLSEKYDQDKFSILSGRLGKNLVFNSFDDSFTKSEGK